MGNRSYIPALKYHWLTKLYDPILQFTMPEDKIKTYLVTGAGFKDGEKILDFGCGSLTLSLLAKKAHPASEFFGVDVDDKILSIASEKSRSENLDVALIKYDGRILPFGASSFDHVMSSLVFHHLTTDQKISALREIKRVLKPAGKLHIADFGLPANQLQRVAFYIIQFLDGFETTTGNAKGILSELIKNAGFSYQETNVFKTAVGTVRTIKSNKLN